MYKQYWRNIIRHYSNKPKNNVRVRFAPSPTGYLHLGGLRTALYNFFFARKHAGKFILRIEDTDQSRLVEDASKQLYNDLVWSGIEIDEGPDVGGSYGPYVQSERVEVYKEQVKSLLNNNTAYYCFCTNKRLELLRKEAVRTRQTPKYDNRCRHLTTDEVSSKLKNGEKFCIRFKFDVTKINASPGKLSPERLNEFNQLEIQRLLQNPKDESILIEQLKVLIESNISMKSGNARLLTDTQYIREILNWAVDRITKLSDLVSRDFMFLWVIPTNEDHLSDEYLHILLNVEQVLSDEARLSDWSRENINEILKVTANEGNFPYNKLMKLLRSILSGLKEGPSVAEIMSILGKENTLNRLKIYLEKTKK